MGVYLARGRALTTCLTVYEDKLKLKKSRRSAAGSARALGARCRRFESCHLDHKETIILIRKISVLWLFYCQNGGISPFFIDFLAKIEACRDSFRHCKPFLFLPVKYKSFTLYPFRSIYGVSFNLCLFIKNSFSPQPIAIFDKLVYNNTAKLT